MTQTTSSVTQLLVTPFRIWDRFWMLSGPPHALAVFRILLGSYWLIRWLFIAPHVNLFFSADGMYFPFEDFPAEGISDLRSFFGFLTPAMPPVMAWLFYLVTIASLCFAIVGRFTRTAWAILHGVLRLSLLFAHPHVEQLVRPLAVYHHRLVGLQSMRPSPLPRRSRGLGDAASSHRTTFPCGLNV